MLEEYFQWFSVMSFLCLWAVYGLTSCGRGNRMPRKVDDPELRKKKLNDVSKKETAQRTSSTYEKTEDASKKGKLLAPRESDSVRHRRGKSKKNTKDASSSRLRKGASKRKSLEKVDISEKPKHPLLMTPAERRKLEKIPSKREELALDRTQSDRDHEASPVKNESSHRSKRGDSPLKRARSLRTGVEGEASSKSNRKSALDQDNNEDKTQHSERVSRSRIRGVDAKAAADTPGKEVSNREKSQRSSKSKRQGVEKTQDERTQGSKRESGTSREKKKTRKLSQYDELRKVRKEVNKKIKTRTETEKTAEEAKSVESPYGARGSKTRKEAADKKKKRTGEKTKTKTEDGGESSVKSNKSSKSSKVKSKLSGLLKSPAQKAKDTDSKSNRKKNSKSKRD